MDRGQFFENFNYPKADKLGSWQLLTRRFGQLSQALFSPSYRSPQDLHKGVIKHYSHNEEVKFYKAYSDFGLHENEEEALEVAIQKLPNKPLRALVIGSGAGRETFALAARPEISTVTGIDTSLEMVTAARQVQGHNKTNFEHLNFLTHQKSYDLIWVTSILESHIQGKKNRIAFFKHISDSLESKGCAVITPLIRPLHWRNPCFWSSQILRLRWFSQTQWEPGDVLVSNLGAHRKNDHLVFSHFYPTRKNFVDELQRAGLNQPLELSQESWVIQK